MKGIFCGIICVVFCVAGYGQSRPTFKDGIIIVPTPTPPKKFNPDPLKDLAVIERAELTPTQAQNAQTMADFRAWEREQWAAKWKPVASTASSKNRTRWYFKDFRVKRDDVEVWLKVVPSNPAEDARRRPQIRGFHYFLQFTVLHCDDRRYSVESLIFYNRRGDLIFSSASWDRIYRNPINPESVNEILLEYFCE